MAKKATIAKVLAGAFDAPIEDLSTTKDITPGVCPDCGSTETQFVTTYGMTSIRCKICGAKVAPADEGQAQSLADYNKDVDTGQLT